MAGFVYLIGTPVFHWYKIGKSKTPEVRIQNLGILLPFKMGVIGIWKAENHSALEKELHDKYRYCKVNGEWFQFDNQEIQNLFNILPTQSRIFPNENNPDAVFARFANIEEDKRKGRRVIGVRTEKLRGDFTPEEREQKRREAIQRQQMRKALKDSQDKISFS